MEKIYNIQNQEIELTEEQKACLNYSGDRTLVVKGYAGGGKSLVLMAAAKKILQKSGAGADNTVGIFSYTNALVSNIDEFLEKNGISEGQTTAKTVNRCLNDIYQKMRAAKKIPWRTFPNQNKSGNQNRLNNAAAALRQHREKYGEHRFHSLDPGFWLEEFDWMKAMNVWTDNREYYLSLPRRGRGGQVRMTAADRETAYQIFTCYCSLLERKNELDWADQALIIARHPEWIPENMKCDYVLIDEAQDLSLAQMLALKQICRRKMLIAMDMNQRIYKGGWWTPKLLGISSTTKKLTKSMRTTKQIEALAESLRSKNDEFLEEDDKSLRAVPERDGTVPEIVHLKDQREEKEFVVRTVREYRKTNPNLTIGIIAAQNKQISKFGEWMTSAGIPYEQIAKGKTFSMASPGVKVVTAYNAKGLEFNCVIMPMFAEGYFPPGWTSDDEEAMNDFLVQQRNLVYVAMTRARNQLVITFWGRKGSRFIREMDSSLYEWKGDPWEFSGGQVREPKEESERGDLLSFLTEKGVEVIDKRPHNGPLWAVGSEDIRPILEESKRRFFAKWTKAPNGGVATSRRPAWFTRSKK